jgi:hypothetical protein
MARGTAGGSARREYERRRAKERERQQANRHLWVTFTLATPMVVYVAARFGLPWIANSLWRSFAESSDVDPARIADPIDASTANLLGLLLAVVATANVARAFWGRRQSTEAWGIGARGEEATGRLLDELPSTYEVVHDVLMPGSRANIDHVVVGPTGVFTIETKSYQGGVTIKGGKVRSSGRDRSAVVDQATAQAVAIAERTGQEVRPIVVVHGGVEVGWFGSPVVGGVRFCSPGRLLTRIASGDAQLTGDQVGSIVARLVSGPSRALGAAPDGCDCGGTWVERQRRNDGIRFLGCSRFPACRRTRSLA